MKQMSLSASRFENKTKRTRKREFLDKINMLMPWSEPVSLIAPHAPTPGANLIKNTAQLHTLYALSNLWIVRRTLLQGIGI